MNLTPEQQRIVEHITSDSGTGYTLVNSVAGSGKTTLLTTIANTLEPARALYLAYNKSIATEASRKFPKSVICSTVHSLAYAPTVKTYSLSLGTFTYRDMPAYYDYEYKLYLLDILKKFFLSEHTDFTIFAKAEDVPEPDIEYLSNVIDQMESKIINCTHDFYLKYFHILLSKGLIHYEPFDFIALDEAGDINPVTLAIVKLLPAKRKILVGDSRQNIYSFNHTINCFSVVDGASFPMSQSFRVSPPIATRVQKFCNNFIDKDMVFVGTKQEEKTKTWTTAFISRTNAFLISKMMELNSTKTPYTLVRSVDDIFKTAKELCFISPTKRIFNHELKFVQNDIDEYYKSYELQYLYKNVYSYLLEQYKEDLQLSTTIKLIMRHTSKGMMACYDEAKAHEKLKTTLLLGTAHSFKGLEVDEVYIADDLNVAALQIIAKMESLSIPYHKLPPLAQSELNLYYVACTRAHSVLHNATVLDYKPTTTSNSTKSISVDLGDFQ